MLSLLKDAFYKKRIKEKLRPQVRKLETIVNSFLTKTRMLIQNNLPTGEQKRHQEELSRIDELQSGNIFSKFIGSVD